MEQNWAEKYDWFVCLRQHNVTEIKLEVNILWSVCNWYLLFLHLKIKFVMLSARTPTHIFLFTDITNTNIRSKTEWYGRSFDDIFIGYWHMWSDSDGSLYFRNSVYFKSWLKFSILFLISSRINRTAFEFRSLSAMRTNAITSLYSLNLLQFSNC